jgi:hypothetical protein
MARISETPVFVQIPLQGMLRCYIPDLRVKHEKSISVSMTMQKSIYVLAVLLAFKLAFGQGRAPVESP